MIYLLLHLIATPEIYEIFISFSVLDRFLMSQLGIAEAKVKRRASHVPNLIVELST